MALGSNSGPDIIMATGGSVAHPELHGLSSGRAFRYQHGLIRYLFQDICVTLYSKAPGTLRKRKQKGRLAGANSPAEALSTNHTSPTDSHNFNNWVTLLSQLPLLLFALLNSFLYQCIPEVVRILGSLLALLLLFVPTAALAKVNLSPGLFFSITMASVWFINSFCAVLQGSLFGQLGTMPSTYSTLFLRGQGLAGIFAALAMFMSMASGVDAQTSALGYFITPCVGILLSLLCYPSLPHLEFARYYLVKKLSQAPAQEPETKAELLQAGEKNGILISPQKAGPALDLDVEKEPESELELEEPQKPVSSVV
ncbi:hypothetical protein U0070_002662 [Myodes glareolus]|uniref:Solute carrier family 29 member 2 n=1 Tax=Myodes glareolus TaxID=447135 RepID=A0AAW0IYJ1_MYOGA